MKTKEVTISNIKFNLSTEPLVSEPEVYPDYPSVPVNQITNKLITNLINYLPLSNTMPGTKTRMVLYLV